MEKDKEGFGLSGVHNILVYSVFKLFLNYYSFLALLFVDE